ncbi:unnamed protein product [marine sediment metagenome]|uniref:Uncharacterized protein n=1 Tax=marine sediment metagenome TaxID=412755 RepID=X0VPI5_9ZZZZ
MGKITGALILVFLIELGLVLFAGTGYANSSMYNFLTNPSAWSSNIFYLLLIAVVSVGAVAIITPGALYTFNQWALFAIASAGMFTFVGSIISLYSFIYSELTPIINGIGAPPFWGVAITSLICGPLMVYYIVAVVEWSRANN